MDPSDETLTPENFKPRWGALGTVLLNGLLLVVAYGAYTVTPRTPWPILVELMAYYAGSGAILLALWKVLRSPLQSWILRPGSWLGYLDLSMTMTAFPIVPIIIFFALNALFRFL